MRLQFIVCKVMQREAYLCAARSKNTVDVVLMPQGLHNEPDKLRAEVRHALDRTCDIQGRQYDASLLGYGLCSNGIVGLSAKIPIVVTRGHDCITLLLGSKDRYTEYFESHRGIYWYSPGWIEGGRQPSRELYEQLLKEYEQKYGRDNAQYPRQCAEFLGWNYDELKGDPTLMQRLLDGDWNDSQFLLVKPGQKIAEDLTSTDIIKAE
ncbi:MAG: DUF1638 domain-containing protein [Planctomycetota bacterium]|jgi:hypothetical protein